MTASRVRTSDHALREPRPSPCVGSDSGPVPWLGPIPPRPPPRLQGGLTPNPARGALHLARLGQPAPSPRSGSQHWPLA